MKPFDLKAALAGKPVVTRSGHAVLGIAHLPWAKGVFRVVCQVENVPCPIFVTEEGKFWKEHPQESNNDLFMASVQRAGWVVLSLRDAPDGLPQIIAGVYATQNEAERKFPSCRSVRIEWEE